MLQVVNLSKIYGAGDAEVRALDDVSFSVDKGEFVAIVGPSGSGKSTLLHLLGGVDRPSFGNVYIDGVDIYSLNETNLAIFRRRHIGLIYQFYNLIPTLDVEENITLPLLLDGRSVDKKHFDGIITTIGLSDRINHLPNKLSGGQQQRVSIGRALITNPAIMLADEPTGNLDSKNSHELIDLLKFSNKKYGQTLIVITHDERISLQADRVISIEDGRITGNDHPGAPRHPSKEGNDVPFGYSTQEGNDHPGAPRHPSMEGNDVPFGYCSQEGNDHPGAPRRPSRAGVR